MKGKVKVVRRADILVGGLLAALGLVIVELSRRMPTAVLEKSLGPGFFPMWLGIGLAICGLYQVTASLFSQIPSEQIGWPSRVASLRVAGFFGLNVFYVASQEFLGFFLTTVIYLILMFRLLGARHWGKLVLIAVLASAVSLYVFRFWLDMPLSEGFLGL